MFRLHSTKNHKEEILHFDQRLLYSKIPFYCFVLPEAKNYGKCNGNHPESYSFFRQQLYRHRYNIHLLNILKNSLLHAIHSSYSIKACMLGNKVLNRRQKKLKKIKFLS